MLKINYKFACWQGYCPTAEEIEDSDIKSLANRLKGRSYEETLTNILEWQDRNIEFWTERHPLTSILQYFILLVTVPPIFVLFALIGIISVIFGSFNIVSFVTWFTALWLTILVTGISLILIIMAQIIHSNRKIPRYEGMKNAFANSLPIKALLENKLGICRDYAKLTACLLINIYPNAEIYFAHAPSHVATGIMIENRLYMLDQRLPLLTIDKWNKYRHLKGKLDKLGRNRIELVDSKCFLSKKNAESQDTQKLGQTMTRLLNIKEQTDDTRAVFFLEIRWKKGAIKYDNDEMVNYSLSRWLTAKFSCELVRIDQITKIEVGSNEEDLIFLVSLNI